MSHRCGANCRRKQVPSQRKDCPSCGSPRLPETIAAGGRTRTVSQHMRDFTHPGITARRVERVLDDWVLRGVHSGPDGRESMAYFAPVPGLASMVRVAVSMDDAVIITAFRDRRATRHWNQGDLDFFNRSLLNMEVRDASQI